MTNQEQQRELVAECRASGMTAKAWCEAKDIKYSRYLNWATKANCQKQHAQHQQWADVNMAKEEYAKGEIQLN